MVGAGTAPFWLVFAEDWFAKGEFIVGELNEVYQFRVMEDPTFMGTLVKYKVELAGGNTEGVPRLSGHVKSSLIDLKLLEIGQQGASRIYFRAA